MDADEQRFRQKVRSEIRAHVAREREAPPLTLWCSEGENPRRVLSARVGAAHDAQGVRSYIVAQIRMHRPAWCAIGRGLHVPDEDGGLVATPMFAVVFCSVDGAESVIAEVVAGDVGAWRSAEVAGQSREEAEEGASSEGTWFFVEQALRTAAKARKEASERG